ncbi:hypothetical protein ACFPTR_11425 [Aliibacillus thermotolerans]|uniref:Uncharacterized protein n=1 Tax=Aliibacillus thermotolerans TaxID=1834418 RepID=A0ABW0U9M0_9BACI|nr:hypothetical protein [Aliibacillus thermotolerans]MDA3129788.1 hypothetical protein [Aliibacillus thermotolerans]
MEHATYSSPYLKEEAQHHREEESKEKKKSMDHKMKPPHKRRDPWTELLFGRRPMPPSHEKEDKKED